MEIACVHVNDSGNRQAQVKNGYLVFISPQSSLRQTAQPFAGRTSRPSAAQ
jgi:hypothetical protein